MTARTDLPDSVHVNERPARVPDPWLEQRLARILCEVIRIERIEPGDDLFELGIHSLLVAQLITRIRSELGVELTMRDVFDNFRFADFVGRVDRELGAVTLQQG